MPPGASPVNRPSLGGTPFVADSEDDVTQTLTEGDIREDAPQLAAQKEEEEKEPVASSTSLPFAEKIFLTVLFFWSYGVMCISYGLPGSCLLDFTIQTGSSLESVTSVITWRCVGVLSGVMIAGPLFKYVNIHVVMSVSSLVMGSTILGVPWCSTLTLLCSVFIIDGIFLGFVHIGTVAGCVHVWKEKSGPIMQAFMFFSTFGSTLAPILVRPFLVPIDHTVLNSTERNSTGMNSTGMNDALMDTNIGSNDSGVSNRTDGFHQYPPDGGALNLKYAYIIVSCLCLTKAVPFIAYFIMKRQSFLNEQTAAEAIRLQNNSIQSPKLRHLTMFVFSIIFFLLGVVEEVPGSLMAAFAVTYLNWTKSVATLVLSVFWFSCMCSRGIGIVLAKFLQPQSLVMMNSMVLVVGAILLNTLLDRSPLVMWFGVGLTGFGFATTNPACMNWLEQIMTLTFMRTSIAYAALYVGKMTTPKFVVYMAVHHDADWFLYTMLIGASSMVLAVTTVVLVLRWIRSTQATSSRAVPVDADLEVGLT